MEQLESQESIPSDKNSKSMVVSAQKKLLSQISTSKSVQKTFLDEETNKLLQLFSDLSREYLIVKEGVDLLDNKKEKEKETTGVKERVHKVHKDLIKLMVKISVLASQHQLNGEELDCLIELREKFHKFVMTFVTYHQMPDCYNREILAKQLEAIRSHVSKVIDRPLSDKSGIRLENVFTFFMDPNYLDAIFRRNSPHKKLMGEICDILQNQLNQKLI